ncbi:MAG TPA: class I SAM-dependent methyltransferase [Acidimicrobiales bacterium]|nr:class I SAM-dependent methyltransferase [Acidimicrobiales bacterium]
MADAIFAHPRLAEIYDAVDDDRSDLDLYLAVVAERGAQQLLDIGCGTGSFASLLAGRGVDVVGVDPAAASLAVAQRKPHASRVRWVLGDLANVPEMEVDLVTMTGNVAMVFLDDAEWRAVLAGARSRLAPGGSLAFEVRRPERRAWEDWTPEATRRRVALPEGSVETWVELTAVDLPLVSFRHHCAFSDDATLISDSTLRFRSLPEIEADLATAGLEVIEVRDAPDRPGLEHVILAQPT